MNKITPVNARINPQTLSKMIGEVAVIASIQTSSLGMTRLDKSASADSDRHHNAKEGTGKTSVKRLPGAEKYVDAIKAKHTQARTVVTDSTTKWGKDRRLLMNEFIGEVAGKVDMIVREHDQLRDEFVSRSFEFIRQAQHNLGTYNVDPPSEREIENAFSLSLELEPVPDIGGYTANDDALENHLKQTFAANIQTAYDEAQKDLLKRLAEPLDNMVNRMNMYERREADKANNMAVTKEGTFKSTIVTNITDIARIFRSFNITGDPFIAGIADKLEAFEGIEHKDLVGSADLRADTAKRADEIRGLLKDWL